MVFHPLSSLQHGDGFVGNRVGEVEVVREHFDPGVVLQHEMWREKMGGSVDDTIEAIESALARRWMVDVPDTPAVDITRNEVTGDVPLAGHQRSISVSPKDFGDGGAVISENPWYCRRPEVGTHMADAGAMGIKACEQRRAGRTAPRAVVHCRQQCTATRECIQVWRRNLRPGCAQIGEAHVVDQYKYDIWTRHVICLAQLMCLFSLERIITHRLSQMNVQTTQNSKYVMVKKLRMVGALS